MLVTCKRTKTRTTRSGKTIVDYQAGKQYRRLYPDTKVHFVIAEDGYKQLFENDFHKYFAHN